MISDPELHKLFKSESDEHLARLDDGLLRLEKTPNDPELLEEVFRESHSLKGAARMLGLTQIETTAHRLETIFNAARKGKEPLSQEAIEQMNTGLTDLRLHVRVALGEEAHPTEPQASLAKETPPLPSKSSVLETLAPQEPTPAPSSPAPPAQANVKVEPFHLDTVRVETHKLDDLLFQVGELSVIQGQAQHRLGLMEALLEQWTALERKQSSNSPGISFQNETLAEAHMRFDSLLKQTRNALFDDNARLQSIMQRLGDQVGGMRLLPLSTLFVLFPRMVRDLSREQGKVVELLLDGSDITVDKRILEEMKDPLMHLIRNAIDHGVEPAGDRARIGKPAKATLRLRATREDAHILLEVIDDGRGLEPDAIRQEASRRGLLDESTLTTMTPQRLQQLVFTPGFSTCRYVTELSGRGIGLDVVRVNVERMKGDIRLHSIQGQGLTVQLRLPLSLATTRLLLARVNGKLYGLPVEFIHTSCRVRSDEIFMLDGRPAISLNGEPVIVAYLADLLELNEEHQPLSEDKAKVFACLVLQANQERLGLLADDLSDEEEVVLKPLEAPLKRVRNVSALTILGSGDICVVLNPTDLLNSAYKTPPTTQAKSTKTNSTSKQATRPVVLLAEDSALIRAMEKRILEDANYEVVTAVDGSDAFNLLSSRPFAAVITDITMPNMDGLTLTERIRAAPQYQGLPVILVTSLASAEDKRRGLDSGANAYIPKPTFDQRVLLDTLKRLVAI